MLEGGWRPWLARWLGRGDLASVAPGVVASAGIDAAGAARNSAPVGQATPTTSWIATPIHLITGLTNLHLDRRGILRLPASDLETFAADFNRTFGDSGLRLTPLASGDFLLQGPSTFTAATTEPARALVADLEASLPKGSEAKALKRLGAELEIWLHTNPLNEVRRRRGELPVSTLWLWGGGADLASGKASLANDSATPAGGRAVPTDGGLASTGDRPVTNATADTHRTAAFGTDPYVAGLCRLNGNQSHPLPDQFTDLLADPQPQRAVLVTEVTPLLHQNPYWTVFEALAEIDGRLISPAIGALKNGALESVVLIANDVQLHVRPIYRFKLWRRPRLGITGLQR